MEITLPPQAMMAHQEREADSGKTIAVMGHGNRVYDVSFNSNGSLIATASDDNTARVWNIASGKEVALFVVNGGVKRVLFCSGDKYVVTASDDGTVIVWELKKYMDPISEIPTRVTQSITDPDISKIPANEFRA